MIGDELKSMTDDAISGLLEAIHNEVTARKDARNAALPEYVWLAARQGHPIQVTRQHARELVEAGTYELVSAPQGDQPTDLCVVATKQGAVIQVTKARAIELLDGCAHRLAKPEEYGAKA